MEKIKFKNIINEWKKYLLFESSYSKILEIIQKLEDLNNKYGTKIVIDDKDGKNITVKYVCPKKQINGSTSLTNLRNSGTAVVSGEKNKSWEVSLTKQTTKGFGPLLYEIAIEYVNIYYNSSLRPDSFVVSSDAKKVWDKYEKRSDVKSMQLDISANNYYKGKGYQNLTPQPEDDTIQNSSIMWVRNSGDEKKWHDMSLSKTYKKEENNIIKLLKNKNLIVCKNLPRKRRFDSA